MNLSPSLDLSWMQRIFHTVLFCHEDLTLLSILDLSWSLESFIQSWLFFLSWLVMKSWILLFIRYWLVMKPWLFLTVLTCHACINSSIQSCLVMKTWPLPPVLSCHEVMNLTVHQVWSRHEELTLLPSLDLSWKHRFFITVSCCHEDLTLPSSLELSWT